MTARRPSCYIEATYDIRQHHTGKAEVPISLIEELQLTETSIRGHVRIQDLVFSLTRQCNAFCDICCNDDGPSKRGAIDITNVRQWIRDFSEYVPYCKTAGFTGGEVFLRYAEMLEIHRHLNDFGFITSITTNGFWGKNVELARKRLLELKALGLVEVSVSMDESHSVWVDTEHAATAAKTALEVGLAVSVTSNFTSPGKSAKQYFEPEWHDRIMWDENYYVLPVGRAKALPRLVKTRIPRDDQLFCPRVQMVIQPNGDVDPCCSVCLDDGVFVVGNLYRQSMPEVLTNMLGDVYLKVITHRGLEELEQIVQRHHPEWKLPPREHSVCHMCNGLRSREDFWMVEDAMRQYGMEILLTNLDASKTA